MYTFAYKKKKDNRQTHPPEKKKKMSLPHSDPLDPQPIESGLQICN